MEQSIGPAAVGSVGFPTPGDARVQHLRGVEDRRSQEGRMARSLRRARP